MGEGFKGARVGGGVGSGSVRTETDGGLRRTPAAAHKEERRGPAPAKGKEKKSPRGPIHSAATMASFMGRPGAPPRLPAKRGRRFPTPFRQDRSPRGRCARVGALQPAAAAGQGPRRWEAPKGAGLQAPSSAPRKKGTRAVRAERGEGEGRVQGRAAAKQSPGSLARERRAGGVGTGSGSRGSSALGSGTGPRVPEARPRRARCWSPAPAGRAGSLCPLRPARACSHSKKKAENRQKQPRRRQQRLLPCRRSEPIPSRRGWLCVCECAALSPHAWHMRKSELRPKSQPYPP